MPKTNPEFTISKNFVILCISLQCYLICLSITNHNFSFLLDFTIIILPLTIITLFYWYSRYIIATIILSSYIFVVSSIHLQHPNYNVKYNTTKSNLKEIKSAIAGYHSKNSKYPMPTISESTQNNKGTGQSLAAILANLHTFGDGTDYTKGLFGGELITDSQGNSFVCIVNNLKDFQSDQSHLTGCNNNDLTKIESYIGGGYVYYPKEGLIRLNFKVNGETTLSKPQKNVGDLFADWTEWSTKNKSFVDEYPVKW